MFTGIIHAKALINNVTDHQGIRTLEIEFPLGFCDNVNIGASVAVDGVCLTVTQQLSDRLLRFDVIKQSLDITTLAQHTNGEQVNVERAAKDGAEIGGHPLSGHIDFKTQLIDIANFESNYRFRFALAKQWCKYIFPKGYIAINGASLTLAEVCKTEGYFDIWLIPETLRVTTFANKRVGDYVNIEIERGTQVLVDTIQSTLEQQLGKLAPLLQQLLEDNNIDLITSVAEQTKLISHNRFNKTDS